jgi:PAS domain-containing protein
MIDAPNTNVSSRNWPAPSPTRLHGNDSATNGKVTLGYVLKNIQDGYYEVDLKGNFKHFNRAMREMIGYEKHQLKGMNYRA